MPKGSRAVMMFRGVASALGAGFIWYGLELRHSQDVIVRKAFEHGSTHGPGDPSKAEAGGSLLEMFSNLFGWVAVGLGGVFLLLAVLPWGRLLAGRKPSRLG